MDVTQALKDTENSLRDFIAVILQRKLGEQWIEKCGVTESRIETWRKRKLTEEKRQFPGSVEERLLYYADFYDIGTILEKHWSGEFSSAFGELRTMRVWLGEMERFRDPDAHRRELLPHQQHLVSGIAGEIRTRLISYRSKTDTSESYYPRMESVRDSVGNGITDGGILQCRTTRLRPGDVLDFVVTASDPLGSDLEYAITVSGHHHSLAWQRSNHLSLTIAKEHVMKAFTVILWIRSPREFHAQSYYDDSSTFVYEILPPT